MSFSSAFESKSCHMKALFASVGQAECMIGISASFDVMLSNQSSKGCLDTVKLSN